jgi:glycosyltransferase involved in cell wall biosynthesis
MRLLHIITGLATGGAEMALWRLLSNLDKTRFKSTVISLLEEGTIGPKLRSIGINVIPLRISRMAFKGKTIVDIARIVREYRPGLVQTWMHHANLLGLLGGLCSGGAAPIVWNVRNTFTGFSNHPPWTRLVIRVAGWLSRIPASIIFNSHAGLASHVAIGYKLEKSTVIPNGFDTVTFRPEADAGVRLRSQVGVSPSCRLIGWVGRYHPVKGVERFLAAVKGVVEFSSRRNIAAIMCGRGISWENPIFADEVRKLGLEDVVFPLEERGDIASVTAAFDVAVSSSESEGFSNAIGEAMCCGVPCVVTDVGDSARIVAETGVVVPPGSASALTRGILQILALRPKERQALGNAARSRVESNFSIRQVAAQYTELYDRVTSEEY